MAFQSLKDYSHSLYQRGKIETEASRAEVTCPKSLVSLTWKEAAFAQRGYPDEPCHAMLASHQNFSATGQEVAEDLAPLIPWLPAPLPGGACSDSGARTSAKANLIRL